MVQHQNDGQENEEIEAVETHVAIDEQLGP